MDFLVEFATAFTGLFIIIDIIGTIPIFLSLTKNLTDEERNKSANLAITIAGILMLIVFFTGSLVLSALGISLSSFKIAGGIILGILGIQLVHGYYQAHELQKKSHDYSAPAIVIGTPLITGPGVISTIIILQNTISSIAIFSAILANLLVNWLILRGAGKVYKFIGLKIIQIISKVMGMILVAIAIEFIASGIKTIVAGGS